MPAANQARFPALRIRSTGLRHAVGAGESRSWISKSPSGASGTPMAGVLCALNVMGVVLSAHSSVTKTLRPVEADAVTAGQQQTSTLHADGAVRLHDGVAV